MIIIETYSDIYNWLQILTNLSLLVTTFSFRNYIIL